MSGRGEERGRVTAAAPPPSNTLTQTTPTKQHQQNNTQTTTQPIITEQAVLDLGCRPEDLIASVLPVPPVTIRPSVDMDGASNEDDVTMKLMQIIEVNSELRAGLARGLPITSLAEHWDFLQISSAMLINSELPGVSSREQGGAAPARPLRGFVQRLKGKQGRFRGNLSGKRVDFSARTVISPDPNLGVDQVAVPLHMATTLTYPERVTAFNLRRLQAAVVAGHAGWPGANFVEKADGGRFALANDKVRRKQAAELRPGDVVERHLQNGDVVLFNRQPSLHRVSIMAFRAVVRPGRTLRFNECVCAPFNADFDGDEMNLHLPQTEEARAEALTLMASTRNLCTPKNGETLIAATQDFLTAAFYLTGKDRFFTRAQVWVVGVGVGDLLTGWVVGVISSTRRGVCMCNKTRPLIQTATNSTTQTTQNTQHTTHNTQHTQKQICQLAAYAGDARDAVELPPPAVLKPLELWTGKQLFGLLLKPNGAAAVWVNLELPEREYSKAGLHMCPKDGCVSRCRAGAANTAAC